MKSVAAAELCRPRSAQGLDHHTTRAGLTSSAAMRRGDELDSLACSANDTHGRLLAELAGRREACRLRRNKEENDMRRMPNIEKSCWGTIAGTAPLTGQKSTSASDIDGQPIRHFVQKSLPRRSKPDACVCSSATAFPRRSTSAFCGCKTAFVQSARKSPRAGSASIIAT